MNLKDMHWLTFRNDSGEEIPAFACMRCTGLALIDDGSVVLKMDKPNTYGSQNNHFLNGPLKISSGLYGLCTRSPGAVALYDSADGTPAAGERWGPRDATWKLKKNTGGFEVVGVTNSTDKLASVWPSPMLEFIGKTDAAITKGNTGTVSIYAGSTLGSETDTTVNMTGVYNRYGDAAISKWVRCTWMGQGSTPQWEMTDVEC